PRANVGATNVFDLWYGDVSLFRAGCTSNVAGRRCPTANNWVGPFTRWQGPIPAPATPGAHDDPGDLRVDPQGANDACPMILASDGGVYRNTDVTATCQSPQFEQPLVSPHATWLLGMSGVHRAGAEAEDLYVGLQDDGPWGTMNAGAATPTWANPDCCDVFDFAADANRVLYTTCCGPGTFLVLTGPGRVGAGGTWKGVDNNDGQTGGVGIFVVDASNSNRLYASNMNAAGPRMVFSTDAGLHWTADPKLDTLMTGSGVFRYTTQRGPGNFSTISPGVGGAG